MRPPSPGSTALPPPTRSGDSPCPPSLQSQRCRAKRSAVPGTNHSIASERLCPQTASGSPPQVGSRSRDWVSVSPMEEHEVADVSVPCEETLTREALKLAALLREMKNGLDIVRGKVEALTSKVKENQYPTEDGISYLEAKHLLLLNYCQCIVYYLLRKAKGLPIEGHPVVRSLVEIRLFLEKVRPIDKKLDYLVQKLTRTASNAASNEVGSQDGVKDDSQTAEDPLKYRPNPDMLVSKIDHATEDGAGVYRPPHFAPTSMDEDKISRKERQAIRKEKEALLRAKQSTLAKELMDEIEGRPEEVRETVGAEGRELTRYKAKLEERAQKEEELFTRAPITKLDKKMEKHLRKSRNGLLGLSDFYDDIRAIPLGKSDDTSETSYVNSGHGGKRFKKQKCIYIDGIEVCAVLTKYLVWKVMIAMGGASRTSSRRFLKAPLEREKAMR
ncbi:hypothetical protein Taro_019802 [Colocasia esculenta]|uniref:Neuroguidin n=1 Tax=Colocasia esculenta TaxID=4460 RepID=A0A843UX71_COLES|nr:hypothetical protein [Colocasia esculenta]